MMFKRIAILAFAALSATSVAQTREFTNDKVVGFCK